MTIVDSSDAARLADAVAAALSGDACVAPVRPADAAALAMLRADVPVAEPDAALIVATSGSTGTPKGVVLSRRALRASAAATHDRLGGPGTWTCALPPHYVAGVMTLVRSHEAGTRARFAASDLSDLAPGPGRSYVSVVPTQLVRGLASADLTARLAGFDAVLVGGAALPADVHAAALERGVRVVRTYGMSETCGGCVYDGVPLAGVTVGTSGGRVTLAGDVLFSGYRLEPEATAAVLRDGVFRTADRGRLAGGVLTVVGRVDDVVVSGGVNVDLAAVQRAADAAFGDPLAGGLVVLGIPDAEWGTRVVAATASDLDLASVRTRLRQALEPAALPTALRRVDSIPRTASGKIDRPALVSAWGG